MKDIKLFLWLVLVVSSWSFSSSSSLVFASVWKQTDQDHDRLGSHTIWKIYTKNNFLDTYLIHDLPKVFSKLDVSFLRQYFVKISDFRTLCVCDLMTKLSYLEVTNMNDVYLGDMTILFIWGYIIIISPHVHEVSNKKWVGTFRNNNTTICKYYLGT